jgi:hypothetical protein
LFLSGCSPLAHSSGGVFSFPPIAQRIDQWNEPAAGVCGVVVDAQWIAVMGGAADDARVFQLAEFQAQHAMGDGREGWRRIRQSHCSPGQNGEEPRGSGACKGYLPMDDLLATFATMTTLSDFSDLF